MSEQPLHVLGYEHRIISTEKTPFHYRVAGLGARYLAWLIDLGILIVLLFIGLLLASLFEVLRQGVGRIVFQFWSFGLLWGYFLLFEWLWSGQTPGKRILSLRVIQWDGTAVSFSQALLRNLVRIIDSLPLLVFPGLVGFLSAICNREQRRLGDFAAGTLVVHLARQPHILVRTAATSEADRDRQQQLRKKLRALDREQKQVLLDMCLRREQLQIAERARLFGLVATYLQENLGVSPGEYESDEKFVLELAYLESESETRP